MTNFDIFKFMKAIIGSDNKFVYIRNNILLICK
jgi:hypothetical protein